MSSHNPKKIPASAGADAILAAFAEDGAVIIQNFLSLDEVTRFNTEIQPALDRMATGKMGDQLEIAEGGDFMGAQTKRLMNTAKFSKTFREEIMDNELLHTLAEGTFCDRRNSGYWFNTTQVIEIGPGNKAQPLHRDQELYSVWNSLGPSAPEATVNFFLAFSPFTDANGATRIVPGSHKWTVFEDTLNGSGFLAQKYETIPVEMDPGDCCFFSGKLLHGGGQNRTVDEYRRGMALSVIRAGLMPENANPLVLPLDIADTMSYRAQAMLGLRSLWPPKHGRTGSFWTAEYEEIGRVLGLRDKEPYPQGA